ncbi:ABC transporter substrate-binding protein [Amycolatopsis magusensis]|uniref:ABC transporter substrate-binding protein n=1 Tax=Amycolatopsis magusensis TaxID=882444 RepID=UPI003C2B74AA
MSTGTDRITPPKPAWWKWLWVGGAALLGAAVVVAVTVVVPAINQASRTCDEGVEQRGELSECTGVTDGRYVFAPDLADVQGRIRAENDAVAASGKPYVSVAVLLPMTLAEEDILSPEWVRHQLQGAYLAQFRANRGTWGGSAPMIRLLLANPGSRLAQWEPVVAELERRIEPEHLVAVTGIGLSLDEARRAMTRLSELNVPIIGSHLAADELSQIPGFLRVSPTSSTYAKSAANYIKPTARTAMLVRDSNPGDLYPKTLADAFTAQFADAEHQFVGRPELYNSTLPGVENTFLQMMPNLCGNDPDVVYFAGRENHLTAFIAELANRRCLDQPITVLTGDLALVEAPDAAMRRGLEANVTVLAPGLAHPQAWTTTPEQFNGGSVAGFEEPGCTECFRAMFPDDRLDDGVAILAHDAMLSAVWAIRHSVANPGSKVTAKDVLQVRNRLHGELAVPGASGDISFDERGDPVNKAVPILRVRVDDTPEFLALAAPGE